MKDLKLFSVEKQEIFLKDGTTFEGKLATVRTDTKKPLGVVGTIYEVVDDEKLYEYMSAVLNKLKFKFNIIQHHEIKGGCRTIAEFELPEITTQSDKDDTLTMRLHVINSFDCTTKAKITAGMWRMICSNGMVVGKKDITIGYRHLLGVNEKITTFYGDYIKNKLMGVNNHITELQKIKYKSDIEMVELIEKHNFLGKRYTEKIIEALSHSSQPKQNTAWKMYNAYTYVITHEVNVNASSKLDKLKKLNSLTSSWK